MFAMLLAIQSIPPKLYPVQGGLNATYPTTISSSTVTFWSFFSGEQSRLMDLGWALTRLYRTIMAEATPEFGSRVAPPSD